MIERLRNHDSREIEWEPLDLTDWPEPDLEIDDDEFARAIAAGRDEVSAA